MNIKACIFDLDGVIVDTAKYHYMAWRELANGLGFDFSPEQNEQLKGVSRMASLEILLKIGGLNSINPVEKERLANEKNIRYVNLIREMTPAEILPGAKELLVQLRAEGILIALGSASKNAMMILERLKLIPLFDAIIDGTKVTKAKPDPEVFLKGAEALGVLPSLCCVFEDAQAGVQAAKTGGMKCIGVGNPETLKQADLVVPALDKITTNEIKTL